MASKYHILGAQTQILYKEKGSKFIAYGFHVDNEHNIKQQLLAVKKEHPTATHHCYAWTIGIGKIVTRANDDGEPANTAGKPILAQIQGHALVNCLIVVVRYFGGTLLGVNGLINAYKSAAFQLIEASQVKAFYPMLNLRITCEVQDLSVLMRTLKQLDAKIHHQDFDERYLILCAIRCELEDTLIVMVKELYQLTIEKLKDESKN